MDIIDFVMIQKLPVSLFRRRCSKRMNIKLIYMWGSYQNLSSYHFWYYASQNNLYCRYIKVPYLKISGEGPHQSRSFASSWQILQKLGVSNDLKGVVMENFSGGKPPDPHFSFLRSHRLSTPLYEFRFWRLYLDSWLKCVPTFRHFQLHFSIFRETVLSICNLGLVKTWTQTWSICRPKMKEPK